jgi:hypothetical protein
MIGNAVRKTVRLLALGAISAGIGVAAYTLSTPSPASSSSCRDSARAMARLELVFGTSRNDVPLVSEEDWTRFLEAEITPRFPAGLTVLRAPGQWLARDGHIVKEDSRILVIWYEPTSEANSRIEKIRWTYRDQFAQESVMRIESMSCGPF